MADELVKQLLDIYHNKVDWPTQTRITPQARAIYDQGLAILDTYRGDPDVLLRALKTFVATNCLPYAYAGAALILNDASYESGDEFDDTGLQHALEWLQKAQSLAPDQFEINILEVAIYLSGRRNEEARTVLQYLNQSPPITYPDEFYLCKAAMHYWYAVRDREKYEQWYVRGRKAARKDTEHLTLLNMRAGFYLRLKSEQDIALETYQEISKLNPKDPWCWHNMSVIYFNKKQYKQAHQCNQHALKLMDFEAARYVEKKIDEAWKGLGRLFG
jgi:tetratricopeptide (TPR) repeat protein